MKWVATVKFDRAYEKMPIRWVIHLLSFGLDWNLVRR